MPAILSSKRLLLAIALAIVAATADAQISIIPTLDQGPCGLRLLAPDGKSLVNDPVAELTAAYLSGNHETFQATALQLLDRARSSELAAVDPGKCSGAGFEYTSVPVMLVWADSDPFGTTTLFTALVGRPLGSMTLSGVSALRQIHVARRPTHGLASLYVSTPTPDPLMAQIPDVASAVLSPLFATVSALSGTLAKRVLAAPPLDTAKPEPGVWLTVRTIRLPHKRASIAFNAVATSEPTADSIAKGAAALSERLQTNDVRYVDCARSLGRAQAALVDEQKVACSSASAPTAKESCIKTLDSSLAEKFDEAVSACSKNMKPPTGDEMKAMELVDGKFREYLTGLTTKTTAGAAKITNKPLDVLSFGLASAVIVAGDLTKTRVKLDNGNLVEDPLGRQISMVVLNIASKPYDPDTPKPTRGEVVKWFVGAVVQPSFGLAGGVSVLAVRGFAVNLGGAFIAVNSLRTDDILNQPPGNSGDTFGLGWASVAFVGASYNFK